jgi:hypothetical protein
MPEPVSIVVLMMTLASPLTESTLSPVYYEDSPNHAEFPELQSHLLGDLAEALTEELTSPAVEQASPSSAEDEHSSHQQRHRFVSPFKDCLDTFGKLSSLRFTRPTDGTVNSYIKFNWPKRDEHHSRPSSKSAAMQYGEDDDDQNEYVRQSSQPSSVLVATNYHLTHASPEILSEQLYSERLGRYSRSPSLPSSSISRSANLSPSSSSSDAGSWDTRHLHLLHQMAEHTVPKLPSHFGFVSQMDAMDRRFFDFCTLKFLIISFSTFRSFHFHLFTLSLSISSLFPRPSLRSFYFPLFSLSTFYSSLFPFHHSVYLHYTF